MCKNLNEIIGFSKKLKPIVQLKFKWDTSSELNNFFYVIDHLRLHKFPYVYTGIKKNLHMSSVYTVAAEFTLDEQSTTCKFVRPS